MFYIDKESQATQYTRHYFRLLSKCSHSLNHLRGVASNVCTRAPASGKVRLGIDIGTVAQTESNGGVLGAHSVHLEVRRSFRDKVHVVCLVLVNCNLNISFMEAL